MESNESKFRINITQIKEYNLFVVAIANINQ